MLLLVWLPWAAPLSHQDRHSQRCRTAFRRPTVSRAARQPTVDQVRWVCNPWGRCFWRPNYYGAYGFYGGPRRFYGGRPWGWGGHRHWRRW
ncbi:hypothetical protein ACVWXL_001564 [Bradyrhizobium sp. GM22.5]